MTTYPAEPGFKRSAPSTSEDAARAIASDAANLRQQVWDLFRFGLKMTADEAAAVVGRSVLSIRPRLSELRAKGLIEDSGLRRVNEPSNKKATVWQAVVPRDLFGNPDGSFPA